MQRRSVCLCLVAVVKTAVASSLALAADGAAQVASRMAGPHWSVDGDWTPDLEEIQRHLRSVHGIDPGSRSIDELLTLHDNDHNRRGHRHGHARQKPSKTTAKGYAKF